MISLLGYLLAVVLVLVLVWWLTTLLPLPAPLPQIVLVLLGAIFGIALINLLRAMAYTRMW